MRTCAFVVAALLAATSALAHHSNSAFQGDKVIELKGTVTQWKWTNPHIWIFLTVDDGKGGKVEWAVEGRPPGVLAYGRVATNDMLREAIAHVNALRPRADVVLATGDLVHAGGIE